MKTRHLLLVAMILTSMSPRPAFAGADDVSARLKRQMQANQQRYGIAGQAVWVAHNGTTLFRGADGYADIDAKERMTAEHVFLAYSVSKLFTSTLILQLAEQGRIDLDKPASAYVSDLPMRWRAITVRQFLNHASGVAEYYDAGREPLVIPATRQAAFSALADKPLAFAPGTDTRYTGTNSLVLSALLETHYGQPYAQIAAERIIDKLGLKHTWLGPAALPQRGVAANYLGKDGKLRKDPQTLWPSYTFGQSSLYTTLDDLSRFVLAIGNGELIGKAALRQFWQPRVMADGRRGGFASGWESSEIDGYREVGHDGGARVRVRIAFKESLDGDHYAFVYLTNGSARNVWSRILVGSAMAATAPERFPSPVLLEKLMRFASRPANGRERAAMLRSIRADRAIQGAQLERAIKNSAEAIRDNLGADAAIRVFALNTELFPDSASSWDSLAQAYQAQGDLEKAKSLQAKARALSAKAQDAGASGD